MKRLLLNIALISLCAPAIFAGRDLSPAEILALMGVSPDAVPAYADTVVYSPAQQLPLHVVTDGGEVLSVGYYAFTPAMRSALDRRVVTMAEGAILDRISGLGQDRFSDVKFTRGTPLSLRDLSDYTALGHECNDKGEHMISWELTDGREVEMSFALDYMSLSGKSRGEVERDFISALSRERHTLRRPGFKFDEARIEEYRSGMTYLKGEIFRIPEVSRNVYLRMNEEGSQEFVADERNPCETLANMVVCGVDRIDPDVTLRVLTHTYGEIQEVKTTLGRLLYLCDKEGCKAYFGVKHVDDEKILASIYLQNEEVGYVHVLGLQVPLSALQGRGEILARTSLYVPVSNVADLYYEQRARTTPIKIKIENE